MKPFIIVAAGALSLLPMTAQALPNPASVFCKTMGGETIIAKLTEGSEIGLCRLANKKIVEEWTLFRMFDGKKPSPRHNPFR